MKKLMRKRVTVYPLRSAMHGAVTIWTRRWGYVCFRPPTRSRGHWWPAYFYLSPNATPWAATLLWGREYSKYAKAYARVRRILWGHGYSTDEHDPQSLTHALTVLEAGEARRRWLR